MIIDHDVSSDAILTAAKYHLFPRDEWKMLAQPFFLFIQTLWKLGGRRYNQHVVFLIQIFQSLYASGNKRSCSEEAFTSHMFLERRKSFLLGFSIHVFNVQFDP